MDNLNINNNSIFTEGIYGSFGKESMPVSDIADYLLNLSDRDIFVGTISDISDNVATVLLSDNTSISAEISDADMLNVGQKVSFLVDTAKENTITLKPLFTNLATQNIAGEALKEASIPVNEKTLSMVSKFMEEKLPIDKETLSGAYRGINSNPFVSLDEITKMVDLSLDLTDSNIIKFHSVVNFENKITDSIDSLIDNIPKEIENFADSDIDSALSLAKNVIDNSLENDSDLAIKYPDYKEGAKIFDAVKPEVINGNLSFDNKEIVSLELSESLNDSKDLSVKNEDKLNLAGEIVSNEDIDAADKKNDYVKLDDLLKNIKQTLEDDGFDLEDKKELLKSELLKNAIETKLKDTWLLEPKEVKNPESINEHLNKIFEDTAKITQSMTDSVKASETLSQAVSNLNENLQFVQTLGDLAMYVQIPMIMNNEANTGDLYVYANKKNLLEKSDNITAMLRLDMKNLGRVDVYVKLSNSNSLSTDFTLEDDDTLAFIEEHIDILNERLEKLGFNVTNSFNTKSNAPSIFDNGEKVGVTVNDNLVGYKGFDVRA